MANVFSPVNRSATDTASPDYLFFCEGCQCAHGVWTTRPNITGAQWKFNGDMEKPTIEPSMVVPMHKGGSCHSFIRAGVIEYLPDSGHALRGQKIELKPL